MDANDGCTLKVKTGLSIGDYALTFKDSNDNIYKATFTVDAVQLTLTPSSVDFGYTTEFSSIILVSQNYYNY